MPYGETKVYFDGSHYIAIPHTKRPCKPKRVHEEDTITVVEESVEDTSMDSEDNVDEEYEEVVEQDTDTKTESKSTVKRERTMTRKELFEELYEQTKGKRKAERKRIIISKMKSYFEDLDKATLYVNEQFERKYRNLVCRRVRLMRKVNLQEFNYFCTFTYDGSKHTEESFRKKLADCFKKMCYRRDWKYVGVWERSPEKNRLHFHGLFYIPEGKMVGELVEVKDYSPILERVQVTTQNTYFNERFGRSDFKEVDKTMIGPAVRYLIKYLEKTGEKIVYSKGLPQFFISDIMDEDVACTIGLEDKKLLLFDDFECWDEGCLIGKVSKDVIAQMRKLN